VDVTDDKPALATRLGADLVANAATEDVVAKVVKGTNGGAHGVLVTAISTSAFGQAIAMTPWRGTVSLLGLPPGEFPTRFSTSLLKRITVRLHRRHAQGSQRGDRLRSRWQAESSSGGWTT
jgi:propanol-preferring alcohol dehydrogenase